MDHGFIDRMTELTRRLVTTLDLEDSMKYSPTPMLTGTVRSWVANYAKRVSGSMQTWTMNAAQTTTSLVMVETLIRTAAVIGGAGLSMRRLKCRTVPNRPRPIARVANTVL
jgi:hypothetical protein